MATRKYLRPSLRQMVEWIALNDDPGATTVDEVMGTVSVALAADLTGHTQEEVARKIVRYRSKHRGEVPQ